MAHILSAPGTAERTGWCCPSCSRAYAPWVHSCPHCPPKTAPVETCCLCGSTEVTYYNYREQPFCRPCANGEGPNDARLTLRLPPYMAEEKGSQRNPIVRTWTEVFPGLQCRLHRAIWTCSPDGEPTGADLEFRLVPEDERGHG